MALSATASSVSFNDVHRRNLNLTLKRKLETSLPAEVISTYTNFQELGFHGDNYTFPILVKAASQIPFSKIGLTLHGQAVKTGFSIHPFVQTALLTMYSAFSDILSAIRVFDELGEKDVVAWNSMLGVYAFHGEIEAAEKLFDEMPVKDKVSYNTMLLAYASVGMADAARRIFDVCPSRDVVSWNTMISAFVKSGDVSRARQLFNEMLERDVVSWNTLISGLLQSGYHSEVLDLFDVMCDDEDVEPDHITFATVLSACANLGSLEFGRLMHIRASELRLAFHPHVEAALIDMYAKCGNIDSALSVFFKTKDKDLYCWNSMISSLAFHSLGRASIKLFNAMLSENLHPDVITFIALLTACSHSGLVTEGCHFFHIMEEKYGISPKQEHYGCMVDLLSRDGQLSRSCKLIESMPFEPNAAVVTTLLSSCLIHEDLELGEAVAKTMVGRRDSMKDGEYMMVVNMYSKCGRWEEANRWREMMNSDDSLNKTAGWSVIEIGGRMHKFLAGDSDLGFC